VRSIRAVATIVVVNTPIMAAIIKRLETVAGCLLLDMMSFNLLVRLAAEAHETPANPPFSENLETFKIADA